jgi:hypothetical protein
MIAHFPFNLLCRAWNPFHWTNPGGQVIRDIKARRRSNRISAAERERRKKYGEPERKRFSCKITRSLDFSGD